jgi:hypothetical protein
MIWFGSSAGVAITSKFHEARSVGSWLKAGWHIALAYVIGFFVLLFILGWEPEVIEKKNSAAPERPVQEQISTEPVPTH